MPSVLVTGAYSNLGSAIVHTFHEKGYVVYGTSTCERKSPEIERTFVMDLSSREVSFYGIDELDVLVNNAGVFTEAPIGSIGEDDLDTVFDLNVKGLIRVTQALLPAIRRCDGSIVNISSMNAVHPGFGSTSHYDASKGAVSAFTRSLAAQTGLRVNAVQPGLISRDGLLGSGLEEYWNGHSVRAAMMDPAEIAALVYFLATSTGIYGQCITIDNGFTLR